MHVYSIIVAYNGLKNNWIDKCLTSLENSLIPNQIIVVDNNSSDESVEHIKQNFPNVILIESKENLGFGGANNLGLKKGLELGGEYFFLLNQDAWIEPNTIELLVNLSKQNKEYGIISPIHLNGKGDALDFNFSQYITPTKCENLYSDFVLNKVKNQVYPSSFICAAAWLLTKECLQKVGGFSPTFFHYGEDDNYVNRLFYKGLKIGVYPKTFIYHDREDRQKSKYFEKQEELKRSLLMRFSNPNLNLSIEKYSKQLTNKILKEKLLFRNYSKDQWSLELKYLKENQNMINNNLKMSKSDIPYIFINNN